MRMTGSPKSALAPLSHSAGTAGGLGAPWPVGAFQGLLPKEVQGLGQGPQACA